MAMKVQFALDVPFCEPEVVGQVIERRVEFVVERRAVLALALQLQGGTSMPPSQGSRIHRCVYKRAVKPKHPPCADRLGR